MKLKPILDAIQAIDNIPDIEQVIITASKHRSWLESRRNGELRLTLIKGKWYALRPNDPDRRGFELGERLGMAAMLKLAREKAPSARDFEIGKDEAVYLRAKDNALVGRWEERDGSSGYYRQADYEKAYRVWAEAREHLKDERANILRLGLEGMKRLHHIEAQGYVVLMRDE